ncbi:MAG: hypothetical protein HY060_16620 [Proteobacteria bacterium]|nr:hypothetical protein [Pseudomonadota bacterium]
MSKNIASRACARRSCILAGVGLEFLVGAADALAHGFAGSRFFPATPTTDDPFVADEMSLPTVTRMPGSADVPAVRELDVGIDVAKRILPNLGIGFGQSWIHRGQADMFRHEGFGNLSANIKYQFFASPEHEALASIGLDVDIGGTGAKRVGAERFTSYTPTLFFGKGFGDLPESQPWLRPFALTGVLGYQLPSSRKSSTTTVDPDSGALSLDVERHPDKLVWGGSLQYSLIYLQSQVRDIGLPRPFDRLIPLVEFSFQTPTTIGFGQKTTGSFNPGVIWSGQYCQIAIEAIIPVNHASGQNVGALAQLHFYLDDLFSGSWLGGPLFGK